MSPAECLHARWKAMRDKFVRELKKVKGRKSGDAGPRYSPSWPLFLDRRSLRLDDYHHFYNADTAIILYIVNTFVLFRSLAFYFNTSWEVLLGWITSGSS